MTTPAWHSLALVIGLAAFNVADAQIVRHAEVLGLSGVVPQPIDPSKRSSLEDFGDTKTQTISALNRIKTILERHGYKMSDVVRMTVYLAADPRRGDGRMDFEAMNEAYRMFFGTAENPNLVARSTVQVAGLASPFYLVEIEVTAAKVPERTAAATSGSDAALAAN
jgi:2-iminobutanoate/2-iminopropanoate deaminase